MKISYDKIADTKYILFKKGKVERTEKKGNVLFDYSKNDEVLGIEVIKASKTSLSLISLLGKFAGYDSQEATDRDNISLSKLTNEYLTAFSTPQTSKLQAVA